MKIFAGPRGSGRTTALIRWARQDMDRRDLVVINNDRREWLIQAFNPGVVIRTYDDLGRIPTWSSVELGIDDFEQFMGRTFPQWYQIGAITLVSDDYINIRPPLTPEHIRVDLAAMKATLR